MRLASGLVGTLHGLGAVLGVAAISTIPGASLEGGATGAADGTGGFGNACTACAIIAAVAAAGGAPGPAQGSVTAH